MMAPVSGGRWGAGAPATEPSRPPRRGIQEGHAGEPRGAPWVAQVAALQAHRVRLSRRRAQRGGVAFQLRLTGHRRGSHALERTGGIEGRRALEGKRIAPLRSHAGRPQQGTGAPRGAGVRLTRIRRRRGVAAAAGRRIDGGAVPRRCAVRHCFRYLEIGEGGAVGDHPFRQAAVAMKPGRRVIGGRSSDAATTHDHKQRHDTHHNSLATITGEMNFVPRVISPRAILWGPALVHHPPRR